MSDAEAMTHGGDGDDDSEDLSSSEDDDDDDDQDQDQDQDQDDEQQGLVQKKHRHRHRGYHGGNSMSNTTETTVADTDSYGMYGGYYGGSNYTQMAQGGRNQSHGGHG